MRAVFICSAGHSGSTLLSLLLGSHPAGVALSEIARLPENLALNERVQAPEGERPRLCDFLGIAYIDERPMVARR